MKTFKEHALASVQEVDHNAELKKEILRIAPNYSDLKKQSVKQLKAWAKQLRVTGFGSMDKMDLVGEFEVMTRNWKSSMNEAQKRISIDYLSKYHFEYVVSKHKYDKHKMIYIQPKDENYKTFRIIQTIDGVITSEQEFDFKGTQEVISVDFKERGHKIKHYDLLQKYGFSI